MLYLSQFSQNPIKILITQHKRVAPGKQYIPDIGGISDIIKPLVYLVLCRNKIHIPHLSLTGTVPTVHRTNIANVKQYPVGMAVSYTRDRTVFILGKRVRLFPILYYQLPRVRKGLKKNRIIFIVFCLY